MQRKVTFSEKEEQHYIEYFSDVIYNNFSMSEELAKAIGTVVVQALTENSRTEDSISNTDLDLDLDSSEEDLDLPESSRDAGEVEEAQGPKPAPDLSQDFAELKATTSNHSEKASTNRYEMVKQFLTK